jgi:hypothetical protein
MRKQLRDAVVAGLTGLPTTGTRVYPGRTRQLKEAHEPTLLVYLRSETSNRAVRGAPPVLERVCTLHVEGRVSIADVPDDTLDTISAEVEAAMADMMDFTGRPPKPLGGLALNLSMTATEMIAEFDGARHIGGVRIEYQVTYRTQEGEPRLVA